MSSEYLLLQEGQGSQVLRSYSYTGGTLSEVGTLTTGVKTPTLLPASGGVIYIPYKETGGSNNIKLGQASLATDGSLSSWSAGPTVTTHSGEFRKAILSPDETRILFMLGNSGTAQDFILLDTNGTVLDTLNLTRLLASASAYAADAGFSENGERVVVLWRNDSVRLLSTTSDALLQLDSLASSGSDFMSGTYISLLGGTEWIAGRSDASTFSETAVVDVSGDAIVISDQKANNTLGAGFAVGAAIATSSSVAIGAAGEYAWNGVDISISSSHSWGFNYEWVVLSSDKAYISTIDAASGSPVVKLFSSAAWGTAADTVSSADFTNGRLAFAFTGGNPSRFWTNKIRTTERDL